ncbi:MAG: hypothetical protein ACREP2_13895 [Rhodanobacteraceae bacterium]
MAPEAKTLLIAEGGKTLTLDYAGALAAHAGESWFGVAVGFRMLQAAGTALSRRQIWNREHLRVRSGHPGSGVRDAVEYVTRCVSRGRYRVEGAGGSGCHRGMRFAWRVETETATAKVDLRGGFIPETFYVLLDRLGTPAESAEDRDRFGTLKRDLAERIWQQPLAELFAVELLEAEAAHA